MQRKYNYSSYQAPLAVVTLVATSMDTELASERHVRQRMLVCIRGRCGDPSFIALLHFSDPALASMHILYSSCPSYATHCVNGCRTPAGTCACTHTCIRNSYDLAPSPFPHPLRSVCLVPKPVTVLSTWTGRARCYNILVSIGDAPP